MPHCRVRVLPAARWLASISHLCFCPSREAPADASYQRKAHAGGGEAGRLLPPQEEAPRMEAATAKTSTAPEQTVTAALTNEGHAGDELDQEVRLLLLIPQGPKR